MSAYSISHLHHSVEKLTQASKRLHLYKNHPLVPRGKTGNESFVEIEPLIYVIVRSRPDAVASAEINAQATLIGGIERGWDEDVTLLGKVTS